MFGHGFKIGVAFHQPGIIHDVSHVAESKEGLDAAGRASYYADGPGGCDGGGGGIPHFATVPAVYAAVPGWENSPGFGQSRGSPVGAFLDAAHYFLSYM